MPVKGREGSCWGFTLPHLKIFWRSQFSSVLSCHKLSVTSLAINPSMHSACKTEDILHRQLGAEMTAVSRLQQPSNLEPLPGCKQHRGSRAIHHWASDSFSKTTNMHPHLPFGFPSAVSPGEIFLKVTLSGTSVLDREQSHGDTAHVSTQVIRATTYKGSTFFCFSWVTTPLFLSKPMPAAAQGLLLSSGAFFHRLYNPCLKKVQGVCVNCVGAQFPEGALMKLNGTKS